MCLRVLYNLYTETSLSQNLTFDKEKLPNKSFMGKKMEETLRKWFFSQRDCGTL